jgi:hypothetical protein
MSRPVKVTALVGAYRKGGNIDTAVEAEGPPLGQEAGGVEPGIKL